MKSFRPVVFTGFSLIEILVATFLVAGIALAITGLAMFGTRVGGEGERQTVAQALGNEEVEVVRTYPYDQVAFTDDIPPGRLVRVKSVTRNTLPYTVKTHLKLVDDPANGTIPPPITPLTADYKQVLFEVTWPGWPGSQGSTSSNVVAAAIITPQASTCTPGAATCPNPTLDCTPGAPAACPGDIACPDSGICPDSTTPPFITCPDSGICSTSTSAPTPPPSSPAACTSSAQCGAGQSCIGGLCQDSRCPDPRLVRDTTAEVCSGPDDPVCKDGIDNDGDGKADQDDPGCTGDSIVALSPCHCGTQTVGKFGRIVSTPYCAISSAYCGIKETKRVSCTSECQDGIDNDGDGLTDGADPQCKDGSDSEGGMVFCSVNNPNACEAYHGCPENSTCIVENHPACEDAPGGCCDSSQHVSDEPVCVSGRCFQCSKENVDACDNIPVLCPAGDVCPASGVCADGSRCGNYCGFPNTADNKCTCRNGDCAQCREWENEPDGTNDKSCAFDPVTGKNKYCVSGNCIQCRTDTDCPAGNICSQNVCKAVAVLNECNDHFDNDGDGLIDLADPQCINGTSES